VPDENVLGIAGARQAADAFGDGQSVPSVRRAAVALFKMKVQVAPVSGQFPAIDAPPLTDEPSHRMPRIFYVSPAAPGRAEVDAPATPPSERQKGAQEDDVTKIPASEYGRVRTLARYGMTRLQVAEFYEATVSEVTRIIRT
jgi:hypothetical protein